MLKLSRIQKISLALFLIVSGLYLANLPVDYSLDMENGLYRRMLPSNDVVPNTYLPYVLMKYKAHDFSYVLDTLSKFDDATHKETPYFLIKTEGKIVSSYPVITGLLAFPIYLVPLLLNKIPELTYHENILKIALLGRVTAAFYTSLSVVLFYLVIEKLSKSKDDALVFSLFFAFGTGLYSVASRGLWLHTSALLICSLVLYVLFNVSDKKLKYLVLGFLSGVFVLNRLTGIVLAVVLLVYVFRNKKKFIMVFLIGVFPTVVYYFLNNYFTYGGFLVEGYSARGAANEWTGNLFESITGFFVSPARGFLFISPPLLLGFIELFKSFKQKNPLPKCLSVIFLFSMILIGRWYAWHGANAFGARMLVDFLPIIGLFAFIAYTKLNKKWIVILLMVYSVFIHTNAVLNRKSRCNIDNNWDFYCLKLPTQKPQY